MLCIVQGLQLDQKLISTIAELCHDQNLLPSIANGAIHDPPEESVSSILPHPGWLGRAHSGHLSDEEYTVAGACWLGVLGATGNKLRHGGAQLASIWTADTGYDDKEEPSRLVGAADRPLKLFSPTSGI